MKLNCFDLRIFFFVKELTLQPILKGKDLIGRARTGMGKTLAFALPITEKLLNMPSSKKSRLPRVLVLAPTRELARQVSEEFQSVGVGLSVSCIYGGAPYEPQVLFIFQALNYLILSFFLFSSIVLLVNKTREGGLYMIVDMFRKSRQHIYIEEWNLTLK